MMDELKIIKFLDGEMTGEESTAFQDEIRMNPSLAKEVERYRKIQDLAAELLSEDQSSEEMEKEISKAVRDYKANPDSFDKVSPEYRREVENARQRYMDGKKSNEPGGTSITPGGMIRRIWYRAAALIILAIIASILIFRPFTKMTSDEVFAKYFHTFHKTDQVVEMARNNNDFLFAVEVYEAGDFDRAAVLFEMLADNSVSRSWSLFYAGSSYVSLTRSEKAIELFLMVIAEGEEPASTHARWQLALSYIRTGKPDLAREQLEKLSGEHPVIPAGEQVYRKDAKRIIRILY